MPRVMLMSTLTMSGRMQQRVPKAREPCAGVVDRDAEPALPERVERVLEDRVLLDRLVLGDLQHDPRGMFADRRREVGRHRGSVRAVDGQVRVVGKGRQRAERVADRQELQLDAQLVFHGLGEPLVRWTERERVEACERLGAHDLPCAEVDDRLERPW